MVKWERVNRTKLHRQLMWTISSSCWCTLLTPYNTHHHRKEPNSVSQTEERRNNRDRIYHSCTLLKIIIMWCRMKSRDITGTRTSAPCIPWLYISTMVYFIACHCASFLMIWSMKLVLFMSCKKLSSFYIMEKMPQIKNVDNFSDGCAGQCKHNTFLNQHRHFLQQARVNISVIKLVSLC